MTKKTPAQAASSAATYSITGCSVTNTAAAANEHTRDAVVALANAIAQNAIALIAVAEALKGPPVQMGPSFMVGGAA